MPHAPGTRALRGPLPADAELPGRLASPKAMPRHWCSAAQAPLPLERLVPFRPESRRATKRSAARAPAWAPVPHAADALRIVRIAGWLPPCDRACRAARWCAVALRHPVARAPTNARQWQVRLPGHWPAGGWLRLPAGRADAVE